MITGFKKGITVVESLIVLAVLAAIFAVVLPQFSQTRETQVLKSAVQDILSVLEKARSQTLASVDSSEYGVRFESDQVIIFKGTTYSSGDPNNKATAILEPASVSDVTLDGVSGNSGSLYFRRLSGMPSKTGAVTITAGSSSKIITVSATGAVSTN